jgi:hypothetical protein
MSSYGFGFGVPTRSGSSAKLALSVANTGAMDVIELVNVMNAANEVTLSWYDQDGNELRSELKTLPAYSQEHLLAGDAISAGDAGSVVIDGTGLLLAGAASYYYDTTTGEVTAGGYGEASEAFGSTLSGTYNTYLDMTNWLRVVNLSGLAQYVVLDYGATTDSLSLPGNGRRDVLIPPDVISRGNYGAFELNAQVSGVLSGSVVRMKRHENSYDYMVVSPVR